MDSSSSSLKISNKIKEQPSIQENLSLDIKKLNIEIKKEEEKDSRSPNTPGTNITSLGSFSDLSGIFYLNIDESVTQSALEDAYISRFKDAR